jgi:hypothetical protein
MGSIWRSDSEAVVDGDFAMLADECRACLENDARGGMNIVAPTQGARTSDFVLAANRWFISALLSLLPVRSLSVPKRAAVAPNPRFSG